MICRRAVLPATSHVKIPLGPDHPHLRSALSAGRPGPHEEQHRRGRRTGHWSPATPARFKWFPGWATCLRVGGNIYRREYTGGEFDDSNYGIYAGPRFISNKGQMSVLFQAGRRTVNGRPCSHQYGLRIEVVRLITQRIWAGGSVEGSRQTELGSSGPNGKAGLSWNTHAFVHYTIVPSLTVRLMGGSGREQTDRYSTRHRSRWGGVMGTYALPLGFSDTAAQQLFLTNFWQPNFLFSRNPPRTRL